jgi:hypothetical protein
MDILEENATNWLVMTPDGSTETKTKSSDLNQLLYGHELWALLDTGEEIWMSDGAEDEPRVTVIPDDNAECYTLRLSNAPDLTLGAHHKTHLVEAMAEMYEENDGESVAPLLQLYDTIREDMIRDEVLAPFLDVFGDKVAEREDGWFINNHLLLTYEGEFYHPETSSRKRSGQSVIGAGSSDKAYRVNTKNPSESISRDVTFGDVQYRLTDKEVKFLGKAVWGIENTPYRGD